MPNKTKSPKRFKYIWFADDISGYIPLCITDTPELPDEYAWVMIPCYLQATKLNVLYWKVRMSITRAPAKRWEVGGS